MVAPRGPSLFEMLSISSEIYSFISRRRFWTPWVAHRPFASRDLCASQPLTWNHTSASYSESSDFKLTLRSISFTKGCINYVLV